MAGQYNLTPFTLNDRAKSPLQIDAAGNLKVVAGATGASADQAQGNVAHDAADAGNPIKMGARATSSNFGAVANNDRVDLAATTLGYLGVALSLANIGDAMAGSTVNDGSANSFARAVAEVFGKHFNGTTWDRVKGDTNGTVVQPALSSTFWNYAAATSGIVNTTTAVTIKTAAGASVRNYLKSLTIDHDTLGAATELAIRDGAAGTVLWRGKLQTAAVEGRDIIFDPPLKGSANTLMEVVTLTAVTGGVYVNATGYTGA